MVLSILASPPLPAPQAPCLSFPIRKSDIDTSGSIRPSRSPPNPPACRIPAHESSSSRVRGCQQGADFMGRGLWLGEQEDRWGFGGSPMNARDSAGTYGGHPTPRQGQLSGAGDGARPRGQALGTAASLGRGQPVVGNMGGSHSGVTIEISPSWARSQHGTSGPHPMGDDAVGLGSGLGFGAVSPRCIFLPQLHGAHKKGRPPPP